MRTPTTLVFLGVMITLVHSVPGGNKKNHILEQEIQVVKENLTEVWEILNELRNQIERLENERNIRHHHHHYHHYYHDNFTEDMNETDFVDHDHSFELQLSKEINLTNSESNENSHHHYHYHIHHKHAKPEEQMQSNGVGLKNPHHCNSNNSNPHDNPGGKNNPHDKENIIAEAYCHLRPNRVLPEKERQNVRGTLNLKQKGSVLEIEMSIRGFVVTSSLIDGSQKPDEAARMHGLHVHEFGDISNGCESAGGHYNPLGAPHGAPDSTNRHIGDLGNILCDENGKYEGKFIDKLASLNGTYSIIGKTLVISENRDDLGLHDDEGSKTNGNSGRRLACCVITKEDRKN